MKIVTGLLFCSLAAFAQPSFEVASIRPSAPPGDDKVKVGLHVDGAAVNFIYLSLKEYIATAYAVRDYQVVGPEWMASQRFDIAATLPAGSTQSQVQEMLQSLLAERFGLKLHRDSKDFPVYAITRTKGPLKLKQTPPDPDAPPPAAPVNIAAEGGRNGVNISLGPGSYFNFANNKLEGKKLTMAQFARTLARFEDRPVVDMTELEGAWDLTLDFTPEDYLAMLIRAGVNSGAVMPPQALQLMQNAGGDSLPTALQALGLKFERRQAPIETLVIDHAEKTPTDN